MEKSREDILPAEHNNTSKAITGFVPGSKNDPYRGYRFTKQLILCFCWVCIGLFNEVIGPTLQDLKDNLGVDYETISTALVTKSLGSMTGAIIGGILHEKFYKHSELILACGVWLGAISTLLIPFTSYIEVVATLFFFSGIAEGFINSGGNTLVLDLWQERAAGPMHSVHFSFGVGAMIAPQIARPFLAPDDGDDDSSMTTAFPTTAAWNATSAPVPESRIEIAYSIIAIIVFLYGFVVLGVYLKGAPNGFPLRKPSEKTKDMFHPKTCGHGYVFFSVEILLILMFYFMHTIGGERAISKFLFSYAVDTEVKFSNQDASSLQTAFWGSFTASRLLGVPIARFLPTWAFILIDVVGATIVAIFFTIYSHKNRAALWATACLMGAFIAVAFPNGMSWANIYLDVTNIATMLMIVGGAIGGFMYQYLTGYLFDKDPTYLGYILIGYGCAMIISFIIMQTLAIVHGRKILREIAEGNDKVIDASFSEETIEYETLAFKQIDTYFESTHM